MTPAFFGAISIHYRARVKPFLFPSVEIVGAKRGKGGKRKAEKRGGQGPSEEERDATLKYVMHELKSELVTELLEGFHK
jgi:hypothetical protein